MVHATHTSNVTNLCKKKGIILRLWQLTLPTPGSGGGHQNISCRRLQCLFCAYWHDTHSILYQTSGYFYKIPHNIIIQPYTIHNKNEESFIKKKNIWTWYTLKTRKETLKFIKPRDEKMTNIQKPFFFNSFKC